MKKTQPYGRLIGNNDEMTGNEVGGKRFYEPSEWRKS